MANVVSGVQFSEKALKGIKLLQLSQYGPVCKYVAVVLSFQCVLCDYSDEWVDLVIQHVTCQHLSAEVKHVTEPATDNQAPVVEKLPALQKQREPSIYEEEQDTLFDFDFKPAMLDLHSEFDFRPELHTGNDSILHTSSLKPQASIELSSVENHQENSLSNTTHNLHEPSHGDNTNGLHLPSTGDGQNCPSRTHSIYVQSKDMTNSSVIATTPASVKMSDILGVSDVSSMLPTDCAVTCSDIMVGNSSLSSVTPSVISVRTSDVMVVSSVMDVILNNYDSALTSSTNPSSVVTTEADVIKTTDKSLNTVCSVIPTEAAITSKCDGSISSVIAPEFSVKSSSNVNEDVNHMTAPNSITSSLQDMLGCASSAAVNTTAVLSTMSAAENSLALSSYSSITSNNTGLVDTNKKYTGLETHNKRELEENCRRTDDLILQILTSDDCGDKGSIQGVRKEDGIVKAVSRKEEISVGQLTKVTTLPVKHVTHRILQKIEEVSNTTRTQILNNQNSKSFQVDLSLPHASGLSQGIISPSIPVHLPPETMQTGSPHKSHLVSHNAPEKSASHLVSHNAPEKSASHLVSNNATENCAGHIVSHNATEKCGSHLVSHNASAKCASHLASHNASENCASYPSQNASLDRTKEIVKYTDEPTSKVLLKELNEMQQESMKLECRVLNKAIHVDSVTGNRPVQNDDLLGTSLNHTQTSKLEKDNVVQPEKSMVSDNSVSMDTHHSTVVDESYHITVDENEKLKRTEELDLCSEKWKSSPIKTYSKRKPVVNHGADRDCSVEPSGKKACHDNGEYGLDNDSAILPLLKTENNASKISKFIQEVIIEETPNVRSKQKDKRKNNIESSIIAKSNVKRKCDFKEVPGIKVIKMDIIYETLPNGSGAGARYEQEDNTNTHNGKVCNENSNSQRGDETIPKIIIVKPVEDDGTHEAGVWCDDDDDDDDDNDDNSDDTDVDMDLNKEFEAHKGRGNIIRRNKLPFDVDRRHVTCAYCKTQFKTVKECFEHYADVHQDSLEVRVNKANKSILASKVKNRREHYAKKRIQTTSVDDFGLSYNIGLELTQFLTEKDLKGLNLKKEKRDHEIFDSQDECEGEEGASLNTCPMCFIKYRSVSSLERHMSVVHYWSRIANPKRGKGLFICSVCGKSFEYKKNMAAHEKNVHQGRKLRVQVYNDRMAHQCEHCEYTSKEKRRLDDHVRVVHLGVTPYKCKFCDVVCKERTSLRDHLYRHFSQKPIQCKYCSYGCIQKGCMTAHLKKNHGIALEAAQGCQRLGQSMEEGRTRRRAILEDHKRHMIFNKIENLFNLKEMAIVEKSIVMEKTNSKDGVEATDNTAREKLHPPKQKREHGKEKKLPPKQRREHGKEKVHHPKKKREYGKEKGKKVLKRKSVEQPATTVKSEAPVVIVNTNEVIFKNGDVTHAIVPDPMEEIQEGVNMPSVCVHSSNTPAEDIELRLIPVTSVATASIAGLSGLNNVIKPLNVTEVSSVANVSLMPASAQPPSNGLQCIPPLATAHPPPDGLQCIPLQGILPHYYVKTESGHIYSHLPGSSPAVTAAGVNNTALPITANSAVPPLLSLEAIQAIVNNSNLLGAIKLNSLIPGNNMNKDALSSLLQQISDNSPTPGSSLGPGSDNSLTPGSSLTPQERANLQPENNVLQQADGSIQEHTVVTQQPEVAGIQQNLFTLRRQAAGDNGVEPGIRGVVLPKQQAVAMQQSPAAGVHATVSEEKLVAMQHTTLETQQAVAMQQSPVVTAQQTVAMQPPPVTVHQQKACIPDIQLTQAAVKPQASPSQALPQTSNAGTYAMSALLPVNALNLQQQNWLTQCRNSILPLSIVSSQQAPGNRSATLHYTHVQSTTANSPVTNVNTENCAVNRELSNSGTTPSLSQLDSSASTGSYTADLTHWPSLLLDNANLLQSNPNSVQSNVTNILQNNANVLLSHGADLQQEVGLPGLQENLLTTAEYVARSVMPERGNNAVVNGQPHTPGV